MPMMSSLPLAVKTPVWMLVQPAVELHVVHCWVSKPSPVLRATHHWPVVVMPTISVRPSPFISTDMTLVHPAAAFSVVSLTLVIVLGPLSPAHQLAAGAATAAAGAVSAV